MDDEGEGRICEGEKWALGIGDRQANTVGQTPRGLKCTNSPPVAPAFPARW